jgi:phage/plasmid primase-like uncharacterized protein
MDLDQPSSEDKQAMDKAKRLWQQGKPIRGTLAERYLREYRGISGVQGGAWAESLRYTAHCWHPMARAPYPALLIKSELAGELHAVQRIYLDPTSGKKAGIEPAKMTLGRLRYGASAVVQQGKDNRLLCIAEGVETALSVAEAMPHATVVASLSIANIKQLVFNTQYDTLFICADNDKGQEVALNVLASAKQRLSQFANTIAIAIPEAIKTDFNDLLCQQGKTAVSDCLHKALSTGTRTKRSPAMDDGEKRMIKNETLHDHPVSIPFTEEGHSTHTLKRDRLQQIITQRQPRQSPHLGE